MKNQGLKAGLDPVKDLEGESERLKEIERLDLVDKDITNDRHLNNVTELACYLTEKPQCTINLLTDNSQMSKNNHGFNIPEKIMLKELPRDISICQYVLELPKEQLIIEDVNEYEKTKNFHKMPMAPNIQFYAGTPIITKRGFTVGTLCIMDKKPGNLAHNQKEGLRLLSDQISNLIELNSYEQDFSVKDLRDTKTPGMEGAYYSSATILFTDFVGFTKITENIEPGELIETLDEFFMSFDQIIENYGLRKVKTIGDSYMAVGGVPEGRKGHPFEACKAGLDILQIVNALNIKRGVLGQNPWEVRVGIHTGPLIAGFSNAGFDIWGDAVNIAARLESASEPGKVQISQATREFLDPSVDLTDRGFIDLKNKGKMQTFFLNQLS